METRAWALLVVGTLAACGTQPDDPPAVADGDPTWHRDVAPILQAHCQTCHMADSIAPFDFDTYEQVAPLATLIATVVEAGTMPPFLAQDTPECTPPKPWLDDLRLTEADTQVLVDWAAAQAPEGDPADAPPPVVPPSVILDDADLIVPLEPGYTVEAGEADEFICFVFDHGFDERQWVEAVQLVPSDTVVAHHGIVFQDVSGEAAELAGDEGWFPCPTPDVRGFQMHGWFPGATPFRTPATSAMPLEPDSRIVVQMHYHPSLIDTHFDKPSLQFEFADGEPEWAAAQITPGNVDGFVVDGRGMLPDPSVPEEVDGTRRPSFLIPAGVKGHVETMVHTHDIPVKLPVFAIGTHMHWLGSDMKIELLRAGEDLEDPDAGECLVQTPSWDFDWQRTFSYDAPIGELPVIRQGDVLRLRCTYNNSMDNGVLVSELADRGIDEPVDVLLGDGALDEMCLAFVGVLVRPGRITALY